MPQLPSDPTEKQQAQSAEHDSGTREIPFPVTIVPGPDAQAIAREEKQRADKHAAAEDSLANSTEKLAWFTLVLAAGTLFLAGAGVWHGFHMRKSGVAADKLAAVTQRNVDLIPEIERRISKYHDETIGPGMQSMRLIYIPIASTGFIYNMFDQPRLTTESVSIAAPDAYTAERKED